jgi:4-hydroxy-3-methylbut-2-enyl diphosphate reductase
MDVVKVGDSIEVEVTKVNDGEGNVLLSRKSVESKKLWEELLADAETEGKVFDAVGKEVVKGGLIASINGVRAFVPASHVSTKYVENLSDFVGQPMKLSVIEVDKSRKRIVASQKNVLLAEMEAEKKQKWAALQVGTKLNGVVRRLTDFGAFVDIGGIDGLVHVTDVAWGRVKHPSDVLKIGQQSKSWFSTLTSRKNASPWDISSFSPSPDYGGRKISRGQRRGRQSRPYRPVRRVRGAGAHHRRPYPHFPDQRQAHCQGRR